MRPFAEIAYVTIAGGVSEDGETELLHVMITPPGVGDDGKPHGCIADIEALHVDMPALVQTLVAQGIEYTVFNAEPPFQTMMFDLGLMTLPEAVRTLIALFETDNLQFENPEYWIAFKTGSNVKPEMRVTDVVPNEHLMLMIYQNQSDAGDIKHTALTSTQWEEYGRVLKALTVDGTKDKLFVEVVVGSDYIEVMVNPGMSNNFLTNLLTIAYRFPTPIR